MVGFYKHDTASWRGGTASLTHEQYRVYHVIVEEVMIQEGPILPHERMLAGLANMSTRAFRSALQDLIDLGKVSLVGGKITNERAEKELVSIRTNRENAGKGGRATRETSAKPAAAAPDASEKAKQINGRGEATLFSDECPKREEKRREEEESPNGLVRPTRKAARTQYPEEFEEFWGAFPTDPLMSKKQTFDVWRRLSREDQQAALDSLPAFKAHCEQHPDYRPVHANRYLSQRRFEGMNALQKAVQSRVFVEVDTPEWEAWKREGLAKRGRGYPTSRREVNGRQVSGWDFPSRWPPRMHLEAAE